MSSKKASFEERISAIEERNKRVEEEKAWETSWTRRLTITLLTYATVVSYLSLIHNDHPFVNGLVPAAGFFLSTLVLKSIRNVWRNK